MEERVTTPVCGFWPLTSDTYYVSASSTGGSTGTYKLSMTESSPEGAVVTFGAFSLSNYNLGDFSNLISYNSSRIVARDSAGNYMTIYGRFSYSSESSFNDSSLKSISLNQGAPNGPLVISFENLNAKLGSFLNSANPEQYILRGNDLFIGNIYDDGIIGFAGNDTIIGGEGDDALAGGGGNDSLEGNEGNDFLVGGPGSDILVGGSGDDGYEVDDAGDQVIEMADEGDDVVASAIHYQLPQNVESLVLFGAKPISGTGNDLDNLIVGNAASNRLDGGGGADTLEGGKGNDFYVYDPADVIVEHANGGADTILSSIDYTLIQFCEHVTLMQGAGDISATGNDVNNTLTGNEGHNALFGAGGNDLLRGGEGNDTLDGGAGADRLEGGAGDDMFYVDARGDVVIETAGAGRDVVVSAIDYALGGYLEDLTLTGDAVKAIGNAADNVLTGNAAANVLNGGKGADTMAGGGGDDLYICNDPGDVVTENAGEGIDTVMSAANCVLAANVENLTLIGTAIEGTGNSDANVLVGNAYHNILIGLGGNDTINGGAGNDTMVGGAGDDEYVVNSPKDSIVEIAGEGTDKVNSAVSFDLSVAGAHVENLTLIGRANLSARGDAGNNVLEGNAGSNVLDGRAGADHMMGYRGNDVYVVDDPGDVVSGEEAGGGIDRVESTVSYVLGEHLEKLVLTGADHIDATGNGGNNVLIGNDGNNVIDGRAGADIMVGGAGNDMFYIDVRGDVVVEKAGGGRDVVVSAIDYALGGYLEDLTLTGDAVKAIGNAADNVLTGNAAANVLNGGKGADTMAGGGGDDLYICNDPGDVVTENTGEGIDTVMSAVNRVLAANVENLTLIGTAIEGTGNSDANVLVGNAYHNIMTGLGGNDTIDGGAGNDTLYGGPGNDELTGRVGNDLFVCVPGDGVDTITDFTPGHDRIDLWAFGGEIGDWATLASLLVPVNGDKDTEIRFADAGNKLILVGVDFNKLDVYDFAGIASGLYLEGDGDGNILTGGDDADILVGLGGDDTITGGGGHDTVFGGAGDDWIIGASGAGNDRYDAGDGVDTLVLTSALAPVAVNLVTGRAGGKDIGKDSLDGFENVIGGRSNDTIVGDGIDNVLDGGTGADVMVGGDGDDLYLVDNRLDRIVEFGGQGTDTVRVVDVLHPHPNFNSYALSANVENLVMLDAAGDAGARGNADANVLTGNAGANRLDGFLGDDTLEGGDGDDTLLGSVGDDLLDGGDGDDSLDGGPGADTMAGGDGDDTYVVNSAADVVTENSGEGTDTVLSFIDFDLSVDTAHVENLTLAGLAINGTGDDGANAVTGNARHNLLDGGLGDDTLDGGAGNDTLIGGLGDDSLQGGAGFDMASYADAGGAVTVDLSVAGAQNTGAGGIDILDGIEGVTGGDFDDALTGDNRANTLEGGAGDDTLDGGLGGDRMFGGAGNDLYTVNSAADRIFENAGDGIDSVESSVSHALAANVENLTLTGSGNINGVGNGEDNEIAGNAGRNVLLGGNGDDTLGRRQRAAAAIGGLGRDVLIGGAGSDKFVFGSLADSGVGAALRDVIGGFRSIEGDMIDLHLIDADILSAGHQAFDYIGAGAFNGVAGELRFANGLMQADVDGDGEADMEIAVVGVSTLAEDDFVLDDVIV